MEGVARPGLVPFRRYLKRRNTEYKRRYKTWLDGTDGYPYAPAIWPAGRCMLTSLPDELLLMVCEPLYQADHFHLAVTCRRLADIAIDLLYNRDIAIFDCLSLRWACTLGIVPTLERALGYGARPDHVFHSESHVGCSWVIGVCEGTWSCDTPLKTAIIANEHEIVRRLIAHGADVNAQNHKGSDSRYALCYDWLFPINFAMGTPETPFFPTFQPGNPQIVRHLLDAGADPNQYSEPRRTFYSFTEVRGFTPLMMAMQAKVPVETVKLLLEHGADPTLVGSFKGTLPSRLNHVRPGHCWDRSPLGIALYCSAVSDIFPLDFDKIRLLLAHGGLNEQVYIQAAHGLDGSVPVLYRHWNHLRIAEVVKMFIAAGSDIASWTQRNIAPLHPLIWWLDKFVARQTRKRRNDTEEKISRAVDKIYEVITLLAEASLVEGHSSPMQKSAIIDARGERPAEPTPLRTLCLPFRICDSTKLIPLLLRYGANMNSTDHSGRTALHLAAMFSCGERVRELVEFLGGPLHSGLLIDPLDVRGWTPLHYACFFGLWNEPLAPVVTARLLLESGADVRARTNNGWTPLALAVFVANPWLVGLLLDYGAHLRDLFIPRASTDGEEGSPALVQVGRILLLRSGRPGDILGIADELAVAKAGVASLLEHRLGIPMPLFLPQPLLPSGHWLLTAADRCQAPPLRVEKVDYQFGMATVEFDALTTTNFEQDIDSVLEALDRHGLAAWIASVHDPRRFLPLFHGVPPRRY
ncbi:hypothetical protein VTI74DRAFT_10673 [Chaetomium olivicolor]